MKARRPLVAIISSAVMSVSSLAATGTAEAATVPSVNGVWYGWVGALGPVRLGRFS